MHVDIEDFFFPASESTFCSCWAIYNFISQDITTFESCGKALSNSESWQVSKGLGCRLVLSLLHISLGLVTPE
jgi:hypothetical protein